jgi:adenosylhomocysteine nucleosidase
MVITDIAILTVIPEEYEAVIASLSACGCKTNHDSGSPTSPNQFGWVTGELRGAGGHVYRIVAGMVAQPGPGRMASAVSATYARYRPQYVLLVGVAGGFPQDGQTKGDVAISSVIYDYDYGKVATDFQPRMDFTYQPDQALLTSAVSFHARDKSWAEKDRDMCPDGSNVVPKLLQGAVASGGKVVDDASNKFFAAVLKAWPKLLAVEMEGAGAAAAIETERAAKHNVGFLMVRGISDMPKMATDTQPAAVSTEGNKAERDRWKKYAATTAANFTIHWISQAWLLAPRPTKRSGSSAPSGHMASIAFGLEDATKAAIAEIASRGESFSAWDITNAIRRKHPDQSIKHDNVKPTTHFLLKRLVDSGQVDKDMGEKYITYTPTSKYQSDLEQ